MVLQTGAAGEGRAKGIRSDPVGPVVLQDRAGSVGVPAVTALMGV